MSLNEILGSGIWALLILAIGFIKIPKLEINIWGLIGKQLNKDVDKKMDDLNKRLDETDKKIEDKFDSLNKKLDEHIADSIEDQMKVRRRAILQFDDDLAEGRKKSREHFINILDTIDHYEKYCTEHPKFPNNMCLFAIEHIKHEYEERLDKNNF